MVEFGSWLGKNQSGCASPQPTSLSVCDYWLWGSWQQLMDEHSKKHGHPTTIAELKGRIFMALEVLQSEASHEALRKAVLQFPKRLSLCIQEKGGHFEHLL